MASIPGNRPNHDRPWNELLLDLKTELQDFISVRVQMFRSEMNDKLGALKASLPMLLIGLAAAVGAFFLFTLAIVFLIAMAFAGQPYQYALAFGIVFVVYGLVGAVCLSFGYNTLRSRGISPERTLRVLKQDQVWMQSEARSGL